MTTLTKQIRRETAVQVRYGKHRGRQIVVVLEPPNNIAFRIKGTRQEFPISIEYCYEAAVKHWVLSQYVERMKDYRAGIRKRKPRKPIFNL